VLLNENFYLLYVLIIMNTAIFDTFAFVIGTNFGANFIVKKISPNKTLEGLVGGMIGSIMFGLICGHIFEINFLPLIFMLGGFLAFIGDLLISYFKRKSGVKDTGSILPGHGGILDRIDSHLIATPILILLL
jgi:phosphatidate cytidylyltransferase